MWQYSLQQVGGFVVLLPSSGLEMNQGKGTVLVLLFAIILGVVMSECCCLLT
jgi:hypothetical protein